MRRAPILSPTAVDEIMWQRAGTPVARGSRGVIQSVIGTPDAEVPKAFSRRVKSKAQSEVDATTRERRPR